MRFCTNGYCMRENHPMPIFTTTIVSTWTQKLCCITMRRLKVTFKIWSHEWTNKHTNTQTNKRTVWILSICKTALTTCLFFCTICSLLSKQFAKNKNLSTSRKTILHQWRAGLCNLINPSFYYGYTTLPIPGNTTNRR